MTHIAHLSDILSAALPGAVLSVEDHIDMDCVIVKTDKLVEAVTFLRDDPRLAFVNFTDLCGADYPAREQRFEVILNLLWPKHNSRIRVKVLTDERTAVPSLTSVFPSADWFEREAYDMYGILFTGHPDLRRLLTDYGFQGYPLRKDFPLAGRPSDMPDVAFTGVAPLEGGPFVTSCGTDDVVRREPRARDQK